MDMKYSEPTPFTERETQLLELLQEFVSAASDLALEINAIVPKDGRAERLLHQAAKALQHQVGTIQPALSRLTGRGSPVGRIGLGLSDGDIHALISANRDG